MAVQYHSWSSPGLFFNLGAAAEARAPSIRRAFCRKSQGRSGRSMPAVPELRCCPKPLPLRSPFRPSRRLPTLFKLRRGFPFKSFFPPKEAPLHIFWSLVLTPRRPRIEVTKLALHGDRNNDARDAVASRRLRNIIKSEKDRLLSREFDL